MNSTMCVKCSTLVLGQAPGNMNRFETAFASAVGAKYAVTFNSGTSTLHAALMLLALVTVMKL